MLARVDVDCGIEVVFIILLLQCGSVGLNGLDSTRLGHTITNGHSLCASKSIHAACPTSQYHCWIKCEPLAMKSDCYIKECLSIKIKYVVHQA